jgi:hypothetical protein
VTRSREDIGSSGNTRIVAPDGAPIRRNPAVGIDDVRRTDPTVPLQTRRSSIDAGSPTALPREDVAHSIRRPSVTSERITRLEGGSGDTRSTTPLRTDTTRAPVVSNRSQPVLRNRDEAVHSISRPMTATGNIRQPISEGRSVPTAGITRTVTEPIIRSPAEVGVRTGGGDQVRSISRSESGVSRAATDRVLTARTPGGSSKAARTLARQSVRGHDVYVRSSDRISRRDVRVFDVGHHAFPGGHEVAAAYHGDGGHGHGDWEHGHGDWGHHDHWWHHGDWHHGAYFSIGFGFTYVHSYYVPADAFVYDVVPVVVEPYPVFSTSFAYYSGPCVVGVSSVRYVYPVTAVAPAVVVYQECAAPPIITPVMFSPLYATPVYTAPVVLPVMAPVYAPVYYYYPAYTVQNYPTYYVEPAPAAEAPAAGGEQVPEATAPQASGGAIGGATGAGGRSAEQVWEDSGSAGTGQQTQGWDVGPASLETGLEAIRNGDMEEARRVLSQVVVSDPNDGMSRMLYATALTAAGQYNEAAEAVRRALATWQGLQLKDYWLPSVYDDAKRFTQTMRDAREFLSDHPERVDAWLLVSWAYAFSGDLEQAQILIDEARKTWPDDASLATLQRLVAAG